MIEGRYVPLDDDNTITLDVRTDWEELHERHVSNRTAENRQALQMAIWYFCIALGCLFAGIALLYFGWRWLFHGG